MNCITEQTIYIRTMAIQLSQKESPEERKKYLKAITDALQRIDSQSLVIAEVFKLLGTSK